MKKLYKNYSLFIQASILLSGSSIYAQSCDPLPKTHISNFVSVLPSAEPDSLRLPSTHTFQMILQEGTPYTNAANGLVKSTFDFTGYIPKNGSASGYISLNHEETSFPAAGVSILDINFNPTSKIFQLTNTSPVDFSGIAGTGRNCSGTVTPWNTVVTCEEILPTSDANNDGYQDIGWPVEIDPVTRAIKDYNSDGVPDKIWGMGRMSHENVVVASDNKTVYEGNDENPGYIFKFVADQEKNLSSGKLYVLKLSGSLETSSTGSWLLVPNSTPTECNNVRAYATSVGATNFNSIEDVEISPLNHMIYFTSKVSSRVYRFSDLGTTVESFGVFVGNSSTNYSITYDGGTVNEQWRDGNDNLTFDDQGNLYVLQDGGRNHIWMVRPCHTAENPKVELFAVVPNGSEPTGMTFSPDYKFMFVSIQHPSNANATVMKDAAGNQAIFNKNSAIVIARKEELGVQSVLPISLLSFDAQRTASNTVNVKWKFTTDDALVRFEVQRMVYGGTFQTIESISRNAEVKKSIEYSFTDQYPYAGDNLYRLKSIDANGNESYSVIKSVTISQLSASAVSISPNPVNGILNISLSGKESANATLKVVNNAGIVLKSEKISVRDGVNQFSYDVQSYASGVYHVIIVTEREKYSTSFIKN